MIGRKCDGFWLMGSEMAMLLFTGEHVASQLVGVLSSNSPNAVKAYVAGTVWELACSPGNCQQLLEVGAVAALLDVIRATAHAAGKKSKKKGGKTGGKKGSNKEDKKGEDKGNKKGKGQQGSSSGSGSSMGKEGAAMLRPALETDPAVAAATALSNATGALHHMSFLDEAKEQLGVLGSLPLLLKLQQGAEGQVYDNLVGILWNVATLAENKPLLERAKAPGFLVNPVPAR
jgi:hypothetical protein